MSDLDALLAEIIARPDEDTLRLAYADCLEERGEPGDAARAEFVRVQVELAGRAVTGDDRARADNIARRVRKRAPAPLRAKTTAVLLAREKLLLGGTHPPPVGVFEYSPYVQWFTGSFMTAMAMRPVFRRGFVDEVTCTAEDWLRHGRDARRLHPITRVNLTTWYPEFDVGLTTGGPLVLTPHGDPLTDWAFPDGPRFGGRTYREASCDALAACYPGVAFTLPEPFRPVAAALEQITGRRA